MAISTGEILSLLRDKINLTQEEVANYLNINREQLSYYENNRREPSIIILNKLADLYGVETSDFFEDEIDQIRTNIAFAFRAESLSSDDLIEISKFKKIVKNYLKLTRLEQKHDK